MDHIAIYFVFLLTAAGTQPGGYIPPQDVRKADMQCGLPGAVVGLQVDTVVNPTVATFPDPGFAGLHCSVSITQRVLTLAPGDYELASTEHGDGSGVPYIGIDPHVSPRFTRTTGGPVRTRAPGNVRVRTP